MKTQLGDAMGLPEPREERIDEHLAVVGGLVPVQGHRSTSTDVASGRSGIVRAVDVLRTPEERFTALPDFPVRLDRPVPEPPVAGHRHPVVHSNPAVRRTLQAFP